MISIVILNWNSKEKLIDCLASIKKHTKQKHEIIIVDNGSTDGSIEFLKDEYPEAKLICNSVNMGVGPARNQGMKIATGEYVLILDVDTILKNSAIDILKKYMDENRKVGIVGAKLLNPDLSIQMSCRNFPTLYTKLSSRITKLSQKRLNQEQLKHWAHDSVESVGYLLGACQLIRREVICEIGVYDDKIFYGPEDIDYCLRAWLAGFEVKYNPNAIIIHDHQRI
ncbi:glycosyltransferase family 2 protein, partial [Planococcus sp. Urea-trap-24]